MAPLPPPRRRLLHDYGLSIVLTALFLVSMVGAAISGWFEYASEQQAHGASPQLLGDDGYVWVLGEQVLQNWQSELLALATLIVLASVLVHRGSPESKDGQAEKARRIADIEARVDELVRRRGDQAEAA